MKISRVFAVTTFELAMLAGLIVCPAFLRVAAQVSANAPTSVNITVCGNGITEAGEFCDDGGNNGVQVSQTGQPFCNMTCSGWAPFCDGGANCSTSLVGGGSVGGNGRVATTLTKVVPPGNVYPFSPLTVPKDGNVAPVTRANTNANFRESPLDTNKKTENNDNATSPYLSKDQDLNSKIIVNSSDEGGNETTREVIPGAKKQGLEVGGNVLYVAAILAILFLIIFITGIRKILRKHDR